MQWILTSYRPIQKADTVALRLKEDKHRRAKLKCGGWHANLAVSKPLQYFISFPFSSSVKTEVFSEECYVQVDGAMTGKVKVCFWSGCRASSEFQ